MSDVRVIVVGTTSDYITLLSRRFPGRILFLTDPAERSKWPDAGPEEALEILCDLAQPPAALESLREFMRLHGIRPTGIACFDCESMSLAAYLGQALSLPYPTPEAITNSRSKFLCKQIWSQSGVPCPEVSLVRNLSDAMTFFERVNHPVVLKPLTGSGSELVFRCENKQDCLWAYRSIASGLINHPNVRMYVPGAGAPDEIDPRTVYLAEEFVPGREYSCDCIMDGDRFDIIRIARKIYAPDRALGTILAYVVPGVLPGELDYDLFRRQLHRAASSLGLTRAMVMVDFIVRRSTAYLLELTPRPGGDCIPDLLLKSSGFDILGAALDFAEGKPVVLPEPSRWEQLVGLRLFASQNGTITRIDTEAIQRDKRVVMCWLKVVPGHEVILPPDNYDSQLLGSVIFRPTRPFDIKTECLEISGLLKLVMETPSWAIPRTS